MTVADLLRRLDAIASTVTAVEHALRDGDVARAVDELIGLDGIVASTKLKPQDRPQGDRGQMLVVDRPAAIIVLEVERTRPRVSVNANDTADVGRLADWLQRHDELAGIYRTAHALCDPAFDLKAEGDDT